MRRRADYFALFAVAAVLVSGCSSTAAGRVTSTTPTAAATPVSTISAVPTQTPSPAPTPVEAQWIPLASHSPSAVIAAAKQSTTLQNNASGQGDAIDVSHLGTPVYVLGLSTSYFTALPAFYDIPLLSGGGAVIGAVLCELNPTGTAIDVIGIMQYGLPHTSGSVAQITVQAALAEVAAQHHTSPKAGTQPQLIYFPFNQTAQDTGQINWKGGGNSPADPMWEFVGTDGNQHFAGDDGHAYYWNELPLASSNG